MRGVCAHVTFYISRTEGLGFEPQIDIPLLLSVMRLVEWR